MHISHKELAAIAADIDDMHHDAMRTFADEASELHFGPDLAEGRRAFLKKAAIGGGAVTFGSALVPVSRLLPAAGAQELTDVDIAVFAQSVELAAVAAYEAGAGSGLLSDGVLAVAGTFLSHHQDHADAFGALAGDAATGVANAALVEALTPALQALDSEAAVLDLARSVENQAVATYAFALTALTLEGAYQGTATILPVESSHAAALSFALGDVEGAFPFGAFESADIADGLDPATYPVA